jgi:CRISPR system Cascade subunit CasD
VTSATLLLRLEAPLQSWGYRSRFNDRDTGTEPTKSGVIGLICCALGRDRREPLDDLRGLRMHVRVDRPGTLFTDFQTAGAGVFRGSDAYAAPKSDGSKGKMAILMNKHYLQDASFLVALEGERSLLEELAAALADPVWPLSLGRRSCPPAVPVLVGMREGKGIDVLRKEPLHQAQSPVRMVTELEVGDFQGELRGDVPLEWPDRQTRSYGARYVRETYEELPT